MKSTAWNKCRSIIAFSIRFFIMTLLRKYDRSNFKLHLQFSHNRCNNISSMCFDRTQTGFCTLFAFTWYEPFELNADQLSHFLYVFNNDSTWKYDRFNFELHFFESQVQLKVSHDRCNNISSICFGHKQSGFGTLLFPAALQKNQFTARLQITK